MPILGQEIRSPWPLSVEPSPSLRHLRSCPFFRVVGIRRPGFRRWPGPVPFLMKDLVLLAMSFYLLKQDVIRLSVSSADAEIVASRLAPARANKTSAAARVA